MGTNPELTRLRFGRFELQPAERRLLADGRVAPIGARAFNLLVVLAERAQSLVSKDELLDRVWPNLVVEENNLQVQISALRKLLGAHAIDTVPGYGYRFTLKPIREVAASEVPEWTTGNNLPRQVTTFVGRARALADLRESFATTRLLTLVGFGGIGKSRLALQAAALAMHDFPDGVWLVELAPLTDGGLVPQAVASVLGVRDESGEPVVDLLQGHVRNRQLLLILDCCEHLIRACGELAEQLLRAGHRMRILATSRERLHVAGESTFQVEPLAAPAPDAPVGVESLQQYEAVRLFVDRALIVQPAFQLTQRTARAVADICRCVEGIPLAVELAAARMRAMSVENLAARIGDRFRLLTRGGPASAPRQQTLRALIDWSYDHLSDQERALFRRLAVFAGGFTLDAAETVGAGDDVDRVDVLDLVADLIEKSLVAMEAEGRRYRLLDTVREYTQQRLEESGEAERVRAQHLDFYLAFAEKGKAQFLGPEQGEWYARFDAERDNFLAAHAFCDRADGGAESGMRLVYALSLYWIHRGGLQLGHRVTLEALARAPLAPRNLARCRAVYIAAQIASCMGRCAESEAYGVESLAIAREIGDRERMTIALLLLALQRVSLGKRAEVRRNVEEALELARQIDHRMLLSSALGQLGELDRSDGRLDAAERLYVEALALARESGEPRSVAVQLVNLASVAIARKSVRPARDMLVEALAIVDRIGSRVLGVNMLQIITGYLSSVGQWERAATLHGAVAVQLEQTGYHLDPNDEAFVAPLIARTRDALGDGAYAAAEATGRTLPYEAILADARAWLQEPGLPRALA